MRELDHIVWLPGSLNHTQFLLCWAQQVVLGWGIWWVQHTDLAPAVWSDLKMSRDEDTNIPHSGIFQRLIFSLLKTRVLFPIWLCLASVSGHWFSLFLGQINLFIIILIDIQPWHSYPVFSALLKIDGKCRLAHVLKNGKARENIAISKKKNHVKKTTASTKKCSVLRLQSFLELLATSFLLKSCLHRISTHSSWWWKYFSFSSFSWWGIQVYSSVCHISNRNIQCQTLAVVLCWTATVSWGGCRKSH